MASHVASTTRSSSGAGQAGVPLAKSLAQAGWRTALVETRARRRQPAINEGCTPTKTMIASARVAYLARRAADYGVTTGDVSSTMAAVRQRKRDLVESWRAGGESRLRAAGQSGPDHGRSQLRGATRARDPTIRRREAGSSGRAHLHQHRRAPRGARSARSPAGPLLHLDHHHGARPSSRSTC